MFSHSDKNNRYIGTWFSNGIYLRKFIWPFPIFYSSNTDSIVTSNTDSIVAPNTDSIVAPNTDTIVTSNIFVTSNTDNLSTWNNWVHLRKFICPFPTIFC